MTGKAGSSSRAGRRIAGLAVAIVLGVIAYTGLWFHMASGLEQRVGETLASFNGNGSRVFCEEADARGYPFRLGLFCRSVYYENVRQGFSLRAGELRSAAQIYQPRRTVGELDGPATVSLPFGPALTVEWRLMRASAGLARPMPSRLSLEGQQMVFREQQGERELAKAELAQLHARSQHRDLEVALVVRGVSLADAVAAGLPPVDGRGRVTLENGAAMFSTAPGWRGRTAVIHEFIVAESDGSARVALSGPLSIGEDGLVDAELSIRFDEPSAVATYLARLLPDHRDSIEAAAGVFGGMETTTVRLRIVRGNVFAGFLPLGTIPPL